MNEKADNLFKESEGGNARKEKINFEYRFQNTYF